MSKPKTKIKPKPKMKLKSTIKSGRVKKKDVSSGGKRVQKPVKKMKSKRLPKRKKKEPELEIDWE